ncbi:MAG TPA: DUF4241 domain-containing protein [Pyrinomonadaceae bacterium]
MQPFTDLNRIFDHGYSFKYKLPNYGVQDVTISTHQIADLILTSGKLLPWDLLMIPDDRYCLKRTLNPGRYPVVLSVADFVPAGDTRVACAMLKIGEGAPVRWEAALVETPKPDGGARCSYGVDSGTGSFMDADVANTLAPLVRKKSEDSNEFEEFCDSVLAEMARHSFGSAGAGDWANITVDNNTGANVIVFSAGWGDGGYASFWGYDESGNVVRLVTDFALF